MEALIASLLGNCRETALNEETSVTTGNPNAWCLATVFSEM